MKLEDALKEERRFLKEDPNGDITCWARDWVTEKNGESCEIRYTFTGSTGAYLLGFVRVRYEGRSPVIDHKLSIRPISGLYVFNQILSEALDKVYMVEDNQN